MSAEIKNLNPKALWKNFYSLTQIPRPSKKEEKAAKFLKEFGEKLNLESLQDEAGNVLIKKPATKGYEDRVVITLQSHIDMVPQKNKDVDHDFEKDPIDAYVDGEWVTARGTTLGADNGMGVAAAMTVLEDNTLEHGPIEAFFTVDEETGMTGAFELKKGFLSGDILLNMDSEDEGELYIGCAGGVDTISTFNYTKAAVPADVKAYKILVKGLKGGHSGMDIILGRGNAIKIINRLMWNAARKFGLRLASVNAGEVRNAIPRESEAIVVVPNKNTADFEALVAEYDKEIKNEYKTIDPGVVVMVEGTTMPENLIDETTQKGLLNAVYGMPNGVVNMIADMPDTVETSTSTGIIKTDKDTIEIAALIRGSVDSRKFDLATQIQAIYEQAGATVVHEGAYPGWSPDIHSKMLKAMKEVYQKEFGKVPEVKVVHAGLECGLIKAVKPDMDAISFGPTIRFPHSPDEKVKIDTVQKFWDFLVYTLKNAPKK